MSITPVSKSLRYLGFYLCDRLYVNLDFHINSRCNKNAWDFGKTILRRYANN